MSWQPLNQDGPHGTATAYRHESGAVLSRATKGWQLVIGTTTHRLPRRATFGHAEALLARH